MALPEAPNKHKPERLIINPTGYAGIGVERFRITSSGNILISGLTDSSSKLFVHGDYHRQNKNN